MTESQKSSESEPVEVPPEIKSAPEFSVPDGDHGELVSSAKAMLSEPHEAFAEFHQTYVSAYIMFADTKAAWVFAAASGLVAYMFGSDEIREVLLAPDCSSHFLIFLSTLGLLTTSVIFAFLVIIPRLTTSGEGVVFFGAVAKKPTADSFVREIASLDQRDLTEVRLKHSYDIARICSRKYTHLRRAFLAGALALMGMSLVILMKQ